MSNNFREKGASGFTPFKIDPISKASCVNGIEVMIEKV